MCSSALGRPAMNDSVEGMGQASVRPGPGQSAGPLPWIVLVVTTYYRRHAVGGIHATAESSDRRSGYHRQLSARRLHHTAGDGLVGDDQSLRALVAASRQFALRGD